MQEKLPKVCRSRVAILWVVATMNNIVDELLLEIRESSRISCANRVPLSDVLCMLIKQMDLKNKVTSIYYVDPTTNMGRQL